MDHLRASFVPSGLASLFLLFASVPLDAQSPASTSEPYLNPSLPVAERVDDLVGRMTLAEKISQMQNGAPAIPRLHIAAYDWWNEGLHGVARSGYSTVFPQAIGLAATWDAPLVERIADTISTEARAKYNQAQREHNDSIYYGLTFWSPNINIDRDPRWGRGQETYGEDPFLTGQIGAAFVRGLQGSDPRYFKVVATAKHFAVHSGPESERHAFDARVSPYDLEDTYLPAFRQLVTQAHVDSVMCAYNAVDGSPACASEMLLQQKLKHDWHFDGYIVSDCAAITDVYVGHKFSADIAHGAAVSVKAGTDLSCGKEYAALNDAVHQGLVDEAAIDAAVRRLFTARFRLGMFDPPAMVPYSGIAFAENDSAGHAALSLQAARSSIVLLKNAAGTLPLAASVRSVAVIGPNAAALAALEGNYNGVASHPVTPLAALEKLYPGHVHYAQGSPYVEGAPVPVPQSTFSTSSNGQGEPGLKAEYFNASQPSGEPVASRVDRNIDFDWNGAAPIQGVSSTTFSVRWSGSIRALAPGVVPFGFSMAHCSSCDDAEDVHLWLDNQEVYSFSHAHTPGRRAPTTPFQITFTDTRPHAIRIEYSHSAPHFGGGLTFNWMPPLKESIDQAVEAARQSDVTIAFAGLSPELEGEEMPIHVAGFSGGDRTSIELPEAQQKLLAAVAQTGKPLVLVLMSGSAIALQDTEQKAAAVLEAWYPGEAGGTAIAETLVGQNNPSGRLPITFYAGTDQLPAFDDYSMQNRTYRYFSGQPLYSFGYGLSYTHFDYSSGALSTSTLKAGDPLQVTTHIRNAGDRDGDEIVEFYLLAKSTSGVPLRRLVSFQKVHLARDETKSVVATIDPRSLSTVSSDGARSVREGDYEIYIGGSQPTKDHGLSLPFRVTGTSVIEP